MTGKLGRGLALRLSVAHEVWIGSREESKGAQTAEKLTSIAGSVVKGGTNESAAEACDIAVLAIPDLAELGILQNLKSPLRGKAVISPIVPMRMENGTMRYAQASGSAAKRVAGVLGESKIVSALHSVPAHALGDLSRKLDFDVLTACDSKDDYGQSAALMGSIEGLRPLYVGPLAMSREIEGITPLLLNAARLNGLKMPSIKLVS